MVGKPNKTMMTTASVDEFLAGIEPEARRIDARKVCEIMQRISGDPPTMWGPAIVGFGVRRYRYESKREGEICRIGFSPRKAALTLYVLAEEFDHAEISALGRVAHGKGCLYIKRLAQVDLSLLETLIERAWRT
jgi:hypothetical protein